jgi:segregation and condensation protein B
LKPSLQKNKLEFLHKHIEALIFCSPSPLAPDEIQKCLTEMFETEVPKEHILEAISDLMEKYQQDDFSFALEHLGGGYQFLTKPAYQTSISILLKQQSQKRLSTAQLETLSIIAYKQPVTKTEVEHIRGVSCDYSIQKLLEKELITIKGKSENVGRPLLYGTSEKFMEYFGINHLTDLPQPKDFNPEINQIGEEKDQLSD